ncbi:Formamidopyrimidine-DNA glycosylase N-terminal domain-containing protein [Chaetomium sp. MPI-SDFR-AT-0129]|nr:Formamidopyrimidine-DNA glycosylase N-terminal domain-containing protein [Chaetomium sp. MPI-SDFR-AT-0129]
MPEIAEIARVVHYLRLHLVGKKIKFAKAIEDTSVFGKVGTSGAEVEKALTGRKVVSAGTQGKYFWLVLDKPPHPVMHFGMTGWIHIKGDRTAYTNYYKKMKPEELDVWPPKHWKFHLQTEQPAVEVAFTDPRRFGRVRLVDCPGESIRKFSPLVENGPDPVVDTDVFTKDYLRGKMRSRRVPIKALILDQTVISGVGNWVGDEVLYQAKLHPEQYCDDFSDEQVDKLFEAIQYVCQFAVDKLGDSDQFPQDWSFHYRWGKGQKGAAGHLPNGEKLAFITVGGRTSCYAPEVQKKSGRLAPGAKEELVESDQEEQKPKNLARAKAVKVEDKKPSGKKRKVKEEQSPVKGDQPPPTGRPAKKGKTTKTDETATLDVQPDGTQRRRSGRLQKKAT